MAVGTRLSKVLRRASRGVRAAASVRLAPKPESFLLSVFHESKLGVISDDFHCGSLVTLLCTLTADGDTVYSRTGAANNAYLFTLMGFCANARWLASPAERFSWQTVVHDASVCPPARARRRWEVRYDYQPTLVLGPNEVVIPYGMHPSIMLTHSPVMLRRKLAALRCAPRSTRLLFSSSLGPIYERPASHTAHRDKLSRTAIAAAIRAHGGFRKPGEVASGKKVAEENVMIYRDTSVDRIPQEDWLGVLASTDFVVCPPGCIMPMSFNIIEALAVGAIPLTNYPEWFFPKLEDGVQCLVFDSEADLLRRIEEIRSMPRQRVAAMRQAAWEYYDRYLDPRSVMARMKAMPGDQLTLHVLDETFANLGISRRPASAG